MSGLSSERQPVRNDHRQAAGALAGGDATSAGLAHLREQVIELLTHLDRPPQALRVQSGAFTLDITWGDEMAIAPVGEAPVRSAPPGPVAGDAASSPGQAAGEAAEYLRSPAVGVFYHAREPGAEPFVSVGSVVQPGQQIGIVEAMKLMMPVEADRTGRIAAVVKGNGEPVEYDEPLFALEPGES